MPSERVSDEESPVLGLLGPRTRHLLALEFGSKAQFDDPSHEWRRLFSELLGPSFWCSLLPAAGFSTPRDVSASPLPWLRLG